MELNPFSQDELPLVFRVIRTALNPNDVSPSEQVFLDTYSKITGHKITGDIPKISPREARITSPHRRARLVQLAVMAALLSNPMRETSVRFVDDLSKILSIREPIIPV